MSTKGYTGSMETKTSKQLTMEAWLAFHQIRLTLLPPLVKHLSDKCGLSEAEYQVFMGIRASEHGQLKPSQLAEDLGWDLGRLSHQVTRMESKGLLAKQQCPEDARSCWIGVTKKGQSLFDKAFPLQIKEVERLFGSALTQEQMKSLIEISQAIQMNIKKVASD